MRWDTTEGEVVRNEMVSEKVKYFNSYSTQ